MERLEKDCLVRIANSNALFHISKVSIPIIQDKIFLSSHMFLWLFVDYGCTNRERISFCIMVSLRIIPIIERRFYRSVEEYEQNRSGRSSRERRGGRADMLHGHNYFGEALA